MSPTFDQLPWNIKKLVFKYSLIPTEKGHEEVLEKNSLLRSVCRMWCDVLPRKMSIINFLQRCRFVPEQSNEQLLIKAVTSRFVNLAFIKTIPPELLRQGWLLLRIYENPKVTVDDSIEVDKLFRLTWNLDSCKPKCLVDINSVLSNTEFPLNWINLTEESYEMMEYKYVQPNPQVQWPYNKFLHRFTRAQYLSLYENHRWNYLLSMNLHDPPVTLLLHTTRDRFTERQWKRFCTVCTFSQDQLNQLIDNRFNMRDKLCWTSLTSNSNITFTFKFTTRKILPWCYIRLTMHKEFTKEHYYSMSEEEKGKCNKYNLCRILPIPEVIQKYAEDDECVEELTSRADFDYSYIPRYFNSKEIIE